MAKKEKKAQIPCPKAVDTKLGKGFEAFWEGLVKGENVILVLLMIAAVVCCFSQVLARYIFKVSAPWTDELGRYAMVWMVLIGAGWCCHTDNHIKIDVLPLIVRNHKADKVIAIIFDLLLVVWTGFFVYCSWSYTASLIESGELSTAVGIPMKFAYGIPLMVGSILMFLHQVELLIRDIVCLGRISKGKVGAEQNG